MNLKGKSKKISSHDTGVGYSVIPGDSAATVSVRVNGTMYNQVQVNMTQIGSQVLSAAVPNEPLQVLSFPFDGLANYMSLHVVVKAFEITSRQWVIVPSDTVFYVYPSPWITPTVTNSLYFIPPGTRATNPANSQVSRWICESFVIYSFRVGCG